MKTKLIVACIGLCVAVLALRAQDKKAAPPAAAPAGLKDLKQRSSYALGYLNGKSMKRQSVDVDTEIFLQGLRAGLSGAKSELSDEDMQSCLKDLQAELPAKAAAANKKEGDAFLAKNKKEEGVVTTKSGLQYKVLKDGKGASPKATDSVTVHYRGTLIDGTEFDSSYKRGEPISFEVTGVIKGWTEALQLMKPGAKWMLYIPSELAYGENPRAGGPIPPNAVLIFEVELLETK